MHGIRCVVTPSQTGHALDRGAPSAGDDGADERLPEQRNHATSCAQVVSALPIAAKDTMNPRTRMIETRPVTLDASSLRDASEPRVPKTVA